MFWLLIGERVLRYFWDTLLRLLLSSNLVWIKYTNSFLDWLVNLVPTPFCCCQITLYCSEFRCSWYIFLSLGSFKTSEVRNSMADQWLELSALTIRAPGSIPDQGTKILHAVQMAKKKKKGNNCWWGREKNSNLPNNNQLKNKSKEQKKIPPLF